MRDLNQGMELLADNARENWEGTHYALQQFYESVRDNKQPISNIHTGARTAISVRMAIDAMRKEEMQFWQPEYEI